MPGVSMGSVPDNDLNLRKRVCKACDRCRLKKSKCDGVNPCNRCTADNSICMYGERKKAQDKIYPKGYVEQLEEQLQQTSDGLRKLYGIAQGEEKWEGPPLAVSANGYPLTHEILERLGVLKPDLKAIFEENPEVLRYKLLLEQREKSQEQRFQTQIPLPGYPAPDNQLMGAYPTSSQLPPTPPTPVQNSDGQAPFNPNSGFNQIDPVISLDPSVLHPQGQSWGQAAPQPLFGDATGLVPYGMPSDYNGLWYPGATDNDPQAMPYYDPTLQ